MAVINLPEWTWVKVATNVNTGIVNKVDRFAEGDLWYYQTFRSTGEAAPPVPTIGEVPEEAVRIFKHTNQAEIFHVDPVNTHIDVYIMCQNNDNDLVDTGKVRVDL